MVCYLSFVSQIHFVSLFQNIFYSAYMPPSRYKLPIHKPIQNWALMWGFMVYG